MAICCGVPFVIWLCLDPTRLVYALLVYSFIVKFLVGDMGFPGVANYVCDGLLLLALAFAILKPRNGYASCRAFRTVGLLVLAFWLIATASSLVNAVDPVLYIWAIRNTFRLFGFFFCCVRLLGKDDVRNIIRFVTVFFWVNVAVSSFQYFVLGTGQDNTNGLFGTGSGGNAMVNLIMFAVSAFTLFGFIQRAKGLPSVLLTLAACCYIAAIAEIKVFFVELVILIGLVVVTSRPSVKTTVIVTVSIAALFAGTQLLVAFNPGFADFFSLEKIIASSSTGGYSNSGNLNRLTAVAQLEAAFMPDPLSRLLGLGFGSGQYTQFFAAPLYAMYGEVLNWNWFTDAAIFLETGWLGLAAYCAIFAFVAIRSFFGKGERDWVARASSAVAVLCLFLFVYNCTLTVDPSCYFVGLLLSFAFISSESHVQLRSRSCTLVSK